MSGWTKVILATALMVVALGCFNLSLWRRLRAAREQAAATDDSPGRN
ncbi:MULTISPECIES: hypothetical protein [unclassified Sphingomonas]|nr:MULTISPECIES: hypothetical protein [unclassified Sphingomonas]MBN8846550.1 hypothetical protein [Sphingomonas sp.]